MTVDSQVAELKERFEVLMKEATQIKVDLEKEQVPRSQVIFRKKAKSQHVGIQKLRGILQ